jgi:hypothetical protein
VHHLLAVRLVHALVGVVADELVVVAHEEGLPHGRLVVVGDGLAAGCDVRDEFPRLALVGRGIEVDLGARQVRGDGAAGNQNRLLGEAGERLVEDVEEWLVAEACRRLDSG